MNQILAYVKYLDHEYRRQLLHAGFGLLLFLFPFLGINVLLLLSFLILISLKLLPGNSTLYGMLDEKAVQGRRIGKAGRGIRGAQNLAAAIFILLLISALLEFTTYSYPLYIIGGAIAISTFGDSAATFVRHSSQSKFRSLTQDEYPLRAYREEEHKLYSVPSSIAMLVIGLVSAFLVGSWIVYWQGFDVSYNMVFFIAVIGAMIGALFESIPTVIDDNLSVPIGSGMAMWMFSALEYSVSPQQMVVALVFSLVLGYLAYRARIADISALLSAALLGVLVIVFTSLSWFLLLLTFYIFGGWVTKYKYRYKESIGLAQSKGGVRSYEHVFCNSTAAVVLAIAYGVYPVHSVMIMYAYLGTVATAIGDTMASEIGTTARSRPRMITTLKPAEPGLDGAVTFLGELAALLGAMIIGVLAAAFGMVDHVLLAIFITTMGGFLGTNIDSLLGATLQNRGLLSNSGVNFVSTFAGAFITAGLYLLVG